MFAHHCGKYSKVKPCYHKPFKDFFFKIYDVSIKKKEKILKETCHFYSTFMIFY